MDATIAVIAAALAWSQAQGQGVAPPAQGAPAPAGPAQGTPPLPPRPKVPGGLVAPRLAPTVIPGARPELPEEAKPAEREAKDAGAPATAEPAPSEPEVVDPPVAPPAPAQPRPIAAVPPSAAATPAAAAPIAPAAAPGGLALNWESLALLTMLFPMGIAAGWLLQRGK
jgi:hypothetical protein